MSVKIHTEVDLKTKNIKVLRSCIEESFDNFFGKKYENRFKGYNDLDKCNEGFIKPRRKPTINKKKVQINVDINSLGDIIQMTEDYPLYKDVEYDINMEGLHKIKEYLIRFRCICRFGRTERKSFGSAHLFLFMRRTTTIYTQFCMVNPEQVKLK